jgi:hypothetical protein
MIDRGTQQLSDPFFRQRQPGLFENVGNQMMSNVFSNGPDMLGKMFGGQNAQGQPNGVGGLPSWMKIAGMFI